MAAASSIQPPSVHSLSQETAPFPESDSPQSRQDEDAASEGTTLRDLPDLEPDEIERRLEKTRKELSNRRKILIKNLPQDTTNQEVHEILKEYELKYCFVDRNKGTAFVTLLNGAQAQDAIRSLHQSSVRGRALSVALQPTDSLLCVTNLPHTFSAARLEELVRSYGNIERSFLVYSQLTGHSKGYGFVEYMKKDSALRARSELLGRPQGERALMVQWTDVNQLSLEQHLHSRCLWVDRLPLDTLDSEELTRLFSARYKPVFCQLAQDEGSPVRGFGVVEYESAEQAEAMLIEMDRTLVGGQEIRLSLCSPGTSGRSTLAALIAAQGVMLSNKKGLLPEPSLAQLLNSMTNPAALQVLMRPYHTGKRGGKFGRPHSIPFLRPPLTAALLQLGKVQQSAMLGNGLVLQNLLHMQLAQQQLLHIKDKHISTFSSLLGDPSRLLLQKALGLRPPEAMALGKGLLGDSPIELGQESVSASSQPCVVSVAGMMPYLQGRPHLSTAPGGAGEPNGGGCASTASASTSDRQPAPPGTTLNSQAQGRTFSLGMSNSGLGPPPGSVPVGHPHPAGLHSGSDTCPAGSAPSSTQTSLLGEPPKEVKLPSNPYLNLASVLPGMVLQGPSVTKAQGGQSLAGVYSSNMPPVSQPSTSHSQSTAGQYSTDTSTDYSQYNQGYSQEAMQQWYQQYQAQVQGYSTTTQEVQTSDYCKEHVQPAAVSSYGDYSSYMQAVSQYYAQPPLSQPAAQVYQHRDPSKEADLCKPLGLPLHAVSNGGGPPVMPAAVLPAYSALPMMPGFIGPPHPPPNPATHTATAHPASDWNHYYYNQARGQKREYPQLAIQDMTSEYVGQHSQGLGGQYADYFKKKRI